MNYKLYKLEFTGGVHFGQRLLEDTDISFQADTLFSALCQEAVKNGSLGKLLQLVKTDQMLFSDAFPYMGKQYYLPKPFIWSRSKERDGDSKKKKTLKKMKYLPAELLEDYCHGEFPIEKAKNLQDLGNFQMKTSVGIRGQEDPQPYRVKYFRFKEGNGLYFLVGYQNTESEDFAEELIEMISYSGIGGKRSSGLGRFEYRAYAVPDIILNKLNQFGSKYVLISSALPKDEELDAVMEGAEYQLIKRSGFVASVDYAPQQMRKKDLYVFRSGSTFCKTFQGDIWDVAAGGRHPVYRYAKGLFMGVV